ncbi:hypothetical protein FQR65_LT08128 [Abscondita terminalis]|nr:hypothetical protein FQR65_LT08128 [Abscondita terminalis]
MYRSENAKETKKNVKELNKNSSSRSNIVHSEERTIERFSPLPGPSRTNLSLSRNIISHDAVPFNVHSSSPTFTNQTFSRATASSPFQRNQPVRSTVPKTLPSYSSPPPVVDPLNNDLNSKLTVKVKASTRFYDDPVASKVPVYQTRSKNKGYLLLINNIRFKANSKEKNGVELDEKNLIALFKGIGFQTMKHRNLSKKQMETNIKAFRDKDSLKKYDIVTVIVMSHGTGTTKGDNTQILSSDDLLVDTSWIIQQFDTSECSHLKEKPKIFIFQCCRGDNLNMVQTDSAATDSVCRQQSDMLIAYATVPGFVAHRDPNNGTWYMQAICQVFMEHACDTDVENLLKIVDDKLRNLVSGALTQTSSFENRGFKTCYLHPKLFEK